MKRSTGIWHEISTVGEKCKAFIPHALPPELPISSDAFRTLSEESLLELGRLDMLSSVLPDSSLLLYMYVRKEAVLSSQIEGTQSTLLDLLLFESDEAPGIPLVDDVKDVSNYVRALDHGIERIRSGFPLSNRLIKELHAILLNNTRGSDKHPGEYRTSQNWIGGSRPGNAKYVPPPPQYLIELMGGLENFIHSPYPSALEKAALSHVQFETIHPFLDGNGRIGRLLVPLILFSENMLTQPLLYLSLYFKNKRDEYYKHLQNVRIEGNWEAWMEFFLEGVKTTSKQASSTSLKLLELFNRDKESIAKIGRQAGTVIQIHEVLRAKPVCSVPVIAKSVSLTAPTIRASIDTLKELNIVEEITGQQRNRVYVYKNYMDLLNEGID